MGKERQDSLEKRKQTTQTASFNLDYFQKQTSQRKQEREEEKKRFSLIHAHQNTVSSSVE